MRQGFVFIYVRTHLALILIYVRTHQWFSSETNVLFLSMWEHINDSQVRPMSCFYLCENTSMILKWDQCLVFIYVRTHQWFSSETNVLFLFMWEHSNDSQVRPMSCFYLCENTSMILKWDQCLVFIYVKTHQWFSSETNVLFLFMWEHINDSQVRPMSCLYLCENTSMILKWDQCLVFIYVRTNQWFSSETKVLSLFMWEHNNNYQVRSRSCFYLCENTSMIFKWGKCLVFIYVRTHQWFSSVAKALSLFMWEHINDSQVRPRHVFIYVRTHQWFSSEAKVLSLFMREHINDSQVRPRPCLYLHVQNVYENMDCDSWFQSDIILD
jgi:hypothetical protein